MGVVTVPPPFPPAAEPCPEPTIVPSYYTTSDAVISSESVFVVEISLACKNGAQVERGVGGGVGFLAFEEGSWGVPVLNAVSVRPAERGSLR